MEKYVTSIKDQVTHGLMNDFEIEIEAESGYALFCFQMDMIHLID